MIWHWWSRESYWRYSFVLQVTVWVTTRFCSSWLVMRSLMDRSSSTISCTVPSDLQPWQVWLLTHPTEQNGRHDADDIFNWISMNEKSCNLIQFSLRSDPKGQINNKSALVQVMAWHRTGDQPLYEPMLTQFIEAYIRYWGWGWGWVCLVVNL